MTTIWRLRAAVLTLLGALGVHHGRYAFATPEHEHHLSAAHAYLAWLGPLVSVVAFLAVLHLLAGLGRRGPEAVPELPGLRRLWPCASVVLLAIFGAQESLETLFAHGHLPGGLVLLGNGGWTAIPIAAAAGAAIALLLRGAERVVRWALARATRPRRSPPSILAPPPVLLVASGSVIARRLAGRAPPCLSSTPAARHRPASPDEQTNSNRGLLTMHRSTRVAALAAIALAGMPAAASAHVTLQPSEVAPGSFQRLDVRVPNERDDASTTEVAVQFPPGFIFVSHEPVPGWDTDIEMRQLDEPLQAHGEQHSEEVDTATFSTDGPGIGPGEFRDFGLSVGLPDDPGAALTFNALQTYSSGEVVRWIGDPDSDSPAPRVQLTATGGEAAATDAEGTSAGDGGSDTLSIIALVVGALGLLAGSAAFVAARRGGTRAAT